MSPYIEIGTITETADNDAWGFEILAQTPDGRDRVCRPLFAGAAGGFGTYPPRPPNGTEILILRPYAGTEGCVAIYGLASSADAPPTEAAGDITAHYGGFEVREAGGDSVEGVLLRPLLDEIKKLVEAVQGIATALTSSPTTAQDGGAAYKAAIVAALGLPGGPTAKLGEVLAAVEAANVDQGIGPLCSPLLRSSG